MAFRFWAFRRWVFPDEFARNPDKALESTLTAGGIAEGREKIEDALPESLRHLAVYRRLQNTREYAMNQGDTPLGMRMPLPRDREVLKNFLVLSVTPPERGTAHTFMPEFVTEVIKQAYIKCSDKEERGNPKRFSIHANAKVAKAVEAYGIEHHEGTTWWNIVEYPA